MASDEAELGIQVERFNMRGAQFRGMFEGGGQERALASRVREWAKGDAGLAPDEFNVGRNCAIMGTACSI